MTEDRTNWTKAESRAWLVGVGEGVATALAYRQRQEARHRSQPTSAMIYFIGSEGGPIKIGYAANPAGRLSELQWRNAHKLSLLATIEGPLSLEREYHRRFAAHRLHGEWFARCPEIEAEITRLNEGAPA